MASHSQLKVIVPVTSRGFGSCDSETLKTAFPGSPIHAGDVDDDTTTALGQELLMDGVVNDAGHTYGEFHRDYDQNGAPDLADVETGGGGLPATPYVPNPSSPEDGFDAATIPDAPDGFMDKTPNTWGSGVGSTLQPSVSSAAISKSTIGEFLSGQSS
jgi:hypothetical protein